MKELFWISYSDFLRSTVLLDNGGEVKCVVLGFGCKLQKTVKGLGRDRKLTEIHRTVTS
jgi:hypothetical protein